MAFSEYIAREDSASPSPPPPDPLSLPRILCLHGGGVTGAVFQTQARALIKALPGFRLVFADAPFLSEPGPGIVPVYADRGPFRRWLRWRPAHPDLGNDATTRRILNSLERCKEADPGTGPWVGLLGFSQGAKIAASLLYDQQVRAERRHTAGTNTDYRFAVLLAGRGPLVSFGPHTASPLLAPANGMSLDPIDFPGRAPQVLRLPTIHVHGLADPGLPLHRQLLAQYHDPRTSTLVEWQGDHRVPLKRADASRVAAQMYKVAREQGIKVR